MTAARMVREFPATFDPWPIVDGWASSHGYRPIEQGVARVYRKGAGIAVGSRMLLVGAAAGRIHLEAWVSARGLVRLMTLFLLPKEITIEPGGFKAVLPRKMGRQEVNDLLAGFGQPTVEEGGGLPGGGALLQPPASGRAVPPPMPQVEGGQALPPPPASQLAPELAAPPREPGAIRSPYAGTARRKRWRIVVGLVGLAIVATSLALGLLRSAPSLEDLNAGAGPGTSYGTPSELYRAVRDGGVAAEGFRKGEDQTISSAFGTTLVFRAGDFSVGEGLVFIYVYLPGPLMGEYRDVGVKVSIRSAKELGNSTWILVGPNWTVQTADHGVLADIQEAIGGQLHG